MALSAPLDSLVSTTTRIIFTDKKSLSEGGNKWNIGTDGRSAAVTSNARFAAAHFRWQTDRRTDRHRHRVQARTYTLCWRGLKIHQTLLLHHVSIVWFSIQEMTVKTVNVVITNNNNKQYILSVSSLSSARQQPTSPVLNNDVKRKITTSIILYICYTCLGVCVCVCVLWPDWNHSIHEIEAFN